MQISHPVDKIFTVPDESASFHKSPEDQLVTTAAKIPDLQHLAHGYLSQPQNASKDNIEKLIYYAQSLDCELSDWASNTPITWSYSAALDASILARSEFTLRQVHRYPDFYTARVWNFYRVSRLIVQSLLLRAIPWLSVSTESRQTESNRTRIERSSMELVNDICASVPFLLGRDLSKMKLPATNCRRELENIWQTRCPKDKDNGARRAGRFSLLWPLYIASSAPPIPEAQREWMRLQLRLITEHGESQARCLCHTESQILLGGTEKFRFDCV